MLDSVPAFRCNLKERGNLCLRTDPPKDGDRIQSPKRVCYVKDRTKTNFQNCNSYVNIPSSQTYR
jgi:hypothetical protein